MQVPVYIHKSNIFFNDARNRPRCQPGAQMIEEDRVSRVHLRVPQKEGKMLAMLEARARIYSRKYQDGAVEFEADAPESLVRRVKQFVVNH